MNSKYMSFTLLMIVVFQMAIIFHLQSKLELAERNYKGLWERYSDTANSYQECLAASNRDSCETK